MKVSKIIISNENEVKNDFKLINDARYRHHKDILAELENDVKIQAETENSIIITPVVGYHRSEDTGYLIFNLEKVETVDNELVLTYHQSSSVGA